MQTIALSTYNVTFIGWQVFRKGRLFTEGDIDCQNIASTCPDVTCDNPQSIAGACCKTCPVVNRKRPNRKRKHDVNRIERVPAAESSVEADAVLGDQAESIDKSKPRYSLLCPHLAHVS